MNRNTMQFFNMVHFRNIFSLILRPLELRSRSPTLGLLGKPGEIAVNKNMIQMLEQQMEKKIFQTV